MSERARRRAAVAVGLCAAVGLSAWAAVTTPFSSGAEAVTALALGLLATQVAVRWRRPGLARAGDGSTGGDRLRQWPWLVLGVALVAWELVCFFFGPRVDHPTVSSLYESATRWRAIKAALFLGWLGLGAALVRR